MLSPASLGPHHAYMREGVSGSKDLLSASVPTTLGAPCLAFETWESTNPRTPTHAAEPAILLPMQHDPMEEYRRLTALYSEMGDIEIRELAGQINDLTGTAQQILRDEVKKRGIGETQQSSATSTANSSGSAAIHYEPANYRYAHDETTPEDDEPVEYSWKTLLCECETQEQVMQMAEALRRAGIDSWIDQPTSRFFVRNPRVFVAADQLEQARMVAAQPIPQDIVEELKKEEAEEPQSFEIPVCPKCKAEDPTLESVEPSNNWLCESCGFTWSDPIQQNPNEQANLPATSAPTRPCAVPPTFHLRAHPPAPGPSPRPRQSTHP
jgi:hypothetical protein